MERKIADEILKFVPFRMKLSLMAIKENACRWLNISEEEFQRVFEKLIEEGLVYEPSPGYYQRVEVKKEKAQAEAKTEEKTEEKQKPIYKAYWPLGKSQGISVTLWPNNLQLQRREKQGEEWKTTQEISLARQILEKLYIRLPHLFQKMKK